MTSPSAGVIGGGIFGVTAALELAGIGIDVTLYEKRGRLLDGATGNNFFRLHRGYHYPRDEATARQARDGYKSFLWEFAETSAVVTAPDQVFYYAIAAEGSLTSAAQFASHCERLGLTCRPAEPGILVPGSAEACFEVDEYYYSAGALRRCARESLARAGVRTELNSITTPQAIARDCDVVAVAAYAGLNEVLTALGCPPRELQYEMCEVAVIDAPRLRQFSLAVFDGPFVSVAPYRDGLHILYDVGHSVHAAATGHANPGLRAGPTRFPQMLASARRFADLGEVRHAGSLFAERVVLPRMDATDARPSEVWQAGPRVLAVLSGKVTASVATGRVVAAAAAAELGLPEPEPAGARLEP